MNLLTSRINRRTIGGMAVGAAATASMARLASAQDATPETVEEEAGIPTLAELEGVTQVSVVANNNSFAIYQPGNLQPGWFVFSLENGSESDASFNLAQLPEGVSVSDFSTFLFQLNSGQLSSLPEWLLGVTFAGGTNAPVGGTSTAMLHLGVGDWVAFSNLAASTQSATTIRVVEPEVEEVEEATAEATPEIDAPEEAPAGVVAPEGFGSTFTVSVADGAINADSSPAAGLNTIGVRNDASLPANFVLLHSAEAVDDAAAADLAASYLAGEETTATLAGGMGVLSNNAFGYVELNAEAGSYVGFSSVVNASGGTQLEDGAVIVFNVG